MSPPPLLSYADLAKKAQNIKSPIAIDRRSSTVSPISVPSTLASSSSSGVPSSSVHLASVSVSTSSSKSNPIGFSSKSSSTTSTTISVSSSSSVSSVTASTTENSSVNIDGDADVEAEIDREGEFNRDRNGSDGKENEKPPPLVNVWQMRFSRMAEVATAKLNGKGPSSSHLDNDHDAVSDEDDDPFVVKPRAQRGEIRQDSNRDSWPQPRQVSVTPGKGKGNYYYFHSSWLLPSFVLLSRVRVFFFLRACVFHSSSVYFSYSPILTKYMHRARISPSAFPSLKIEIIEIKMGRNTP